MNTEQAFRLYESKWWIGKTPYEIVSKQLFADKEFTSWRVFQAALSEVLERHVSNEEVMRNFEGLRKEFLTLYATKE